MENKIPAIYSMVANLSAINRFYNFVFQPDSQPSHKASLYDISTRMKHTLCAMLFLLGSFGLLCSMSFSSDASQKKAGTGRSFKGPVGIQLYSLRNQFAKDVPSSLDQVRGFGLEYVELAGTYNLPPMEFKKLLNTKGLKAVSGHFPFERVRDHLEDVVREAKALGLEYVGCAWIPHQGEFNEKNCREAISVFNRAGEVFAKEGFKLFYHLHGYEFHPHGEGTLLDLMMAETNPKYVSYQMDVFWVVHAGHDPVKLLEKYGSRFTSLHVKDMKQGTPTGLLTGHSDVSNNVPIGTGIIDWPGVLNASRKAGVKWYFIEDESPSVVEQVPLSLRYLERVKF